MNEEQRLCGVIPVNEDWHAKLCFLTVCFILPLNNNILMLLIFCVFLSIEFLQTSVQLQVFQREGHITSAEGIAQQETG